MLFEGFQHEDCVPVVDKAGDIEFCLHAARPHGPMMAVACHMFNVKSCSLSLTGTLPAFLAGCVAALNAAFLARQNHYQESHKKGEGIVC